MQMLSFLMTLNSKHKTEQLKTKETKTPNTKHTERRKRILTEEQIEDLNLNEPILNKLMTTRE